MLDGALTHWKGDPGQVPAKEVKRELRSLVASPVASWERHHSALSCSAQPGEMAALQAGQQQWEMEMPSEASLLSLLSSAHRLARVAFPQLSPWDLSFLLPHFPHCSLEKEVTMCSAHLKSALLVLPWCYSGYECPCQGRDHEFDPWSGNIPLATKVQASMRHNY